jgi:three-Cys-motif partner protein
MSNDTLHLAKPDQHVHDSVNEWHWTAHLIFNEYINSYIDQVDRQGKKLILVDLFAGSGVLDFEGKIYLSPSLAVLGNDSIEKLVLLEADDDKFDALESRVQSLHPDSNVDLFPSNPNLQLDRIKDLLSAYTNRDEYLVLCTCMPQNLELHFNTLAELAALDVDFAVLHGLPLSVYRGPRGYVSKNFERISNYVSMMEWAAILDQPQYNLDSLTRLFADLYHSQMKSLGYPDFELRHTLKVDKKNPEFFLGYHSKQSFANNAFIAANQVLETQLKLLM